MKLSKILKAVLLCLLPLMAVSCSDKEDQIIFADDYYSFRCPFYVDFIKDGESIVVNSPSLFDPKGTLELVCPYTVDVQVEGGELKGSTIVKGTIKNCQCYLLIIADVHAYLKGGSSPPNGIVKAKINFPQLNNERTDTLAIGWNLLFGGIPGTIAYNKVIVNGDTVWGEKENEQPTQEIPVVKINVD